MKSNIFLFAFLFIFTFNVEAQQEEANYKKNNLFFQVNRHFEKRGTEKFCCSNPDLAISYERKVAKFGNFGVLSGIRTGVYREYVLTGYGWEHPNKNRYFLGGSLSGIYDSKSWFIIQATLLTDVLLPDDYDETWSYWAVEPSFYYLVRRNIYVCLTATMGSFLFFDPKAYMAKAGFRIGFFF